MLVQIDASTKFHNKLSLSRTFNEQLQIVVLFIAWWMCIVYAVAKCPLQDGRLCMSVRL